MLWNSSFQIKRTNLQNKRKQKKLHVHVFGGLFWQFQYTLN